MFDISGRYKALSCDPAEEDMEHWAAKNNTF